MIQKKFITASNLMAWVILLHLCHYGYFQENNWQKMLVKMCEKKNIYTLLIGMEIIAKLCKSLWKIYQKLIVRILFTKPQHFWDQNPFIKRQLKAHSCCSLLDRILYSKRWWFKRRPCSTVSESLLSLVSLLTWKCEF